MRIDRRLLAWSLAGAVLISIGGGWVLSRSNGDGSVGASDPTPADGLTITTNADVVGDRFPDVERERIGDGATARILGGDRPMVINFWYTTCPPCRREMPALGDAARTWAGRVDFVGINPLDPRDTAVAFMRQAGADFDGFLDPDGDLMSALGVTTMPLTLFVAADGEILDVHAGEITAEIIDATIRDLFGV